MKLLLGLGNPGPKYDATRHNVGWWALDRLAYDWKFDSFRKTASGLVSEGVVAGEDVVLVKPTTYMNRSGAALRPHLGREGFAVSRDLMVIVDDATREAGRLRLRPSGSAGGHNGLKSVESVLRHEEYPRLRIGVGRPPEGGDLVSWVLSPMDAEDEDQVLAVLAELSPGLETWMRDGLEAAMNQLNR